MFYLFDAKKYLKMNTEELWQNRKFFLFWIIGFLISLLFLCALTLTSIIIFSNDKAIIINEIIKNINNNSNSNNIAPNIIWNVANNSFNSNFSLTIINMILITTVFIILLYSIYKSYKIKSFKVISTIATLFVFVNVITNVINLIMLAADRAGFNQIMNISVAYILIFIVNVSYIIIYLIFSRQVSLIRKIFILASIQETNLFNNMNNMMQMDPNQNFNFDQYGNPIINDNQTPIYVKEQQQEKTKNDDFSNPLYVKLTKLNREEINLIAQKYSISGYEDMSKEELINKIWQIYKITNSDLENNVHFEDEKK